VKSEAAGQDELENWEQVSYTDLNLDGMNDPYAGIKFKVLSQEQRKVSNYAI
jgi:hypothetical protein